MSVQLQVNFTVWHDFRSAEPISYHPHSSQCADVIQGLLVLSSTYSVDDFVTTQILKSPKLFNIKFADLSKIVGRECLNALR